MSFHENLTRYQRKRGETNYRLAKELQISKQTVKNWHDGEIPKIAYIKKLADHYGCTIDELMKEDDTPCASN